MLKRIRSVLIIAAALLAVGVPIAWACNTPVFRYALERWQPDAYEVVVLHKGELADKTKYLIEKINAAAEDEKAPANVAAQAIDLDGEIDPGLKEIIEKQGTPKQFPWSFVFYPQGTQTDRLAYSGPFDEPMVDALLDSQARREIVKRIVAGDSAVWVFIESGKADEDEAAYKLLVAELARLEKSLKLPDQEADPVDALFPAPEEDAPAADLNVELQLKLSSLRISRTNEAEKLFLSMLLNSEGDLHEYADQPIAIPVFGRGRSYYALVGKGIDAANLEDLNAFLTGACSCQVKSENPGADMLVAANWDALVSETSIADKPLPELTGLGSLELADAKPPETEAVENDQPSSEQHSKPDAQDEAAAVKEPAATAGTPATPVNEAVGAEMSPAPVATASEKIASVPLWLPIGGVVVLGLLVLAVGTAMMTSRHHETS